MGTNSSKDKKVSTKHIQRKPTVIKKLHPKNSTELKSSLRRCVEEGRFVTLQVGEHKTGWAHFRELYGKDIVIINGKFIKKSRPTTKRRSTYSPNIEKTKKDLQGRIGDSPILEIEDFENWGESQQSHVTSCSPKTKDEMARVIQAANAEDLKIRCVAEGHSWAPIFADDKQLLIRANKMESDYEDGSRIRIANKDRYEVDVMTGVTTDDFKQFQLDNEMCLEACALLDCVQMIGLVATGSHGVGWDTMCPSDHVIKMRIFDSSGDLKTYTCDDDKDMFKAVIANFGCFGVIYDMTIQLEPEVIVNTENRYYKLDHLFVKPDTLKNIVENNWSVQILWFPYNSLSIRDYKPTHDDVFVRVINKHASAVDVKHKVKGHGYYVWKDTKDYITQDFLSNIAPSLASDQSLTPYFSWASFKGMKHVLYPEGTIHQELPHAIHYRKHITKAPVSDMEFAFDLKGDFDSVLKIIQVVVNKIDHYEEKDEYPLNLTLEMRWMKYSDAYLATAIIGNPEYGGSGHVFWIEVISVAHTTGWEEFCKDVGQEWIKMGGVPHLAKEFDFLPGIYDHIYDKMGVSILSFKEQLEKSGADPKQMFINDGMKKLLRL